MTGTRAAAWLVAWCLGGGAALAGGLPPGEETAPRAAAPAARSETTEPAADTGSPGARPPPDAGSERATQPVRAAPAPDPAAKRPRGDDATEHWDLAAHFRSGHRLYARFLITNQGPGENTAVALGQVVTPEGEVVTFQNGRREGRWRITADGRHLEIGSSELHLDADVRRIVVDNQKREFELALTLPADGSAHSAPPIPGGARLDLLNLASPATGRLRMGGGTPVALEGRAVLTHAWSPGDARESALRRLDVATFHAERNLFLSEWRGDAGRRWRWVVLASQGGDPPGPFTLELRTDEKEGVPYPIPRQIELRGKDIRGAITLGGRVLEVDPLDALPSLLKLVYSFGSPRHVWLDASLDVTAGTAEALRNSGPDAEPDVEPDFEPDFEPDAEESADAGTGGGEGKAATPPRLHIEGPALVSVFFLDTVPPQAF